MKTKAKRTYSVDKANTKMDKKTTKMLMQWILLLPALLLIGCGDREAHNSQMQQQKQTATMQSGSAMQSTTATSAGEQQTKRWYSDEQLQLGKQVFAQNCASCHGINAQGTFNWKKPGADGSFPPPPLNGSAHSWHHPLKLLMRTIDQGGVPLGGKMPGFKDKLSKEEKLAAIAYFQSKWSDKIYNAWVKRGGLK